MKKFKKAIRSFSSDRRGNVAIIFALTAVPALLITGAGLDFARALHVRTQVQQAADAAAFAVAAAGSISTSQKEALARKVFDANTTAISQAIPLTFNPAISNGEITVNASASVPSTFLRLSKVFKGPDLDVLEMSVKSKVVSAGKSLELALMLDVTGSMSGQKLADMKWAAKDLIDIVMPAGGPGSPTRVALVPFSNRVNAGEFADEATGLPAVRTTQGGRRCVRWRWRWRHGQGWVRECRRYRNFSGSTTYLKTCVTERQGSYRYKDDAPAAGRYVGPYNPGSSTSSQYSSSGGCSIPVVKTMSTDRDMIRAHIDSFTAGGGTAGHLGTAWAWYMVSPEWNNIWPIESRAKPYDDDKNIKAVVLMTDGGFNTDYSSGYTSTQMARQLCTKMKEKGVVVYTIGFGIYPGSTQRQTMVQCATSPNHYFFPYNGDQLRAAFAEIGRQLVYAQGKPRLAN